ncbi:MAG TPA: HIT domain-containing protein [Vicinamibacterales bacterium]|nr:HIT domain-containing protein [Vicinamibacterales bacterium]
MSLERLWTPWRLAYVSGGGAATGCVFCAALNDDDAAPLIVFKGESCFVILNLFPYNNAHLLVVPNRHVATLAEATPAELNEVIALARIAELAITETYAPHGMNLGINLGKPAGAGVPGHLHMHVVPRWDGDTNFMTVVGQTRVLPEELPFTADKLRPIFERLSKDPA